MTYTYYYYQAWDFYPVLGSGIFLLLLSIAMSIYGCMSEVRLSSLMYGIGRMTFRSSLKTGEDSDKRQYFLFGRQVSKKILHYLGIICLIIWQSIFGTFWAVFLIDESFSCDESLDCFPFNKTGGELIQDYPIDNCEEFAPEDGIRISCYQFVLKYAEAIGAAGGVLIVATSIIEGHLELLIWLRRKMYPPHSAKSPLKWRLAFYVFAFTPCVLALSLLVIGSAVPFFRGIWFKTRSSTVVFLSYAFTITAASISASYTVKIIDLRENKREKPLLLNGKTGL